MQAELDSALELLRSLAASATPAQWLLQVLVVASCLAAGWAIAHKVESRVPTPARVRLGGGFRRVAVPLFAFLLLVLARSLIARHQPVLVVQLAQSLVGALLVIRAAVYMLGHLLPEGAFLRNVVRAVAWIAWIAVVLHVTGLLPDVIGTLDDVGFTVGKQKVSLWLAMKAVGALAIALTVALWLGRFTEGRVLAAESLQMSTRVVIAKLVRATAVLAAILVALPLVGIDVTTLSIFGGALGVGLGFGLQKIASNYVSGFIVLLDRSLRIGDVITVDGRRGEVRAIESRYTVIRGGDGVETIVPNEMLITQSVNHHTYSDPRVSLVLPVLVGYGSDVERALSLLIEIARRQADVLSDPAPIARVKSLAESGADVELIVWIGNPVHDGAVRGAILLEILRVFRAEGIEIPYPHRAVKLLAPDGTQETPAASST